jgi:two-component system, sensor histidine kinase and response regulator
MGLTSAIGKGSTFWFTANLDRQADDPKGTLEIPEQLRDMRVLLVDDNATHRAIVEFQLRRWGMRGRTAANAGDALGMLRRQNDRGTPFELAIVDLDMPGTNGLQLAKAIKADPTLAATRIIMLMPSGVRGEPVDLEQAGIERQVAKPVRQAQLYDCLIDAALSSASLKRLKRAGATSNIATAVKFSGALSGRRILLAEDNPMNQAVASGMLELMGVEAQVVANGREAVDLWSAQAFDLVLVDCQMPVMDGYEATRAIRQLEKETHAAHRTPIVALTANAVAGDREACIAAGMDDYLSKPFKYSELEEMVRRWLSKARSCA